MSLFTYPRFNPDIATGNFLWCQNISQRELVLTLYLARRLMCIIQFLDKDGGQSLNEYLPKFTEPRNTEPRKGHFLSDIYQKRN